MHETPNLSSDQEFAKSCQILNRGKKKELLLDDDVGGNVSLRLESHINSRQQSFGWRKRKKKRERERERERERKREREMV